MRDAYAALAHLRSLSYVDGVYVGLMGGSHGGSTTLTSMIAPDGNTDLLAKEGRGGFAAAVALRSIRDAWRRGGPGATRACIVQLPRS